MKRLNKPLIMIICLLLVFVLAACGSKAENSSEYLSYNDSKYSERDMAMVEPGFVSESASSPTSMMPSKGYDMPQNVSISTAATPDVALLAEKIIYTANRTIETTEFDASVAAIEQLLTANGGFIANSSVNGRTKYNSDGTSTVVNRYGSFTLRVPVQNYRAMLDSMGELGNIISKSENAENITARFTDREARKLSLETQEKRLLELMAKAEDMSDIVTLESRLAEVRYEIESIESTLRNWQSQVDYSTVYINLTEVAKYTPTVPVQRSFWERITAAIAGSWEDFVDGSQDFLIDLIYALPGLIIFIIIVAVLIIIIVKLVRRCKRKRKEGKIKLEKTSEPQTQENEEKRE